MLVQMEKILGKQILQNVEIIIWPTHPAPQTIFLPNPETGLPDGPSGILPQMPE